MKVFLTALFAATALSAAEGSFRSVAGELLEKLEAEGYSGMKDEDIPSFQKDLAYAILQRSGYPAGLGITFSDEKQQPPQVSMLPSARTAVLSIPFLGNDLKEALVNLQKQLDEMAPQALLIDLKSAGGDSQDAAERLVAFCSAVKLPFGILINGRTNSCAEALLPKLKASGAILFGTQTSGFAGPVKQIVLANGTIISIPVRSASAIQPDFRLDPAKEASWTKMASDALVAISILGVAK